MGTNTPDKIVAGWKIEKISPEQAIGHILQYLIRLEREAFRLAGFYRSTSLIGVTPAEAGVHLDWKNGFPPSRE